MVEKRNPTSEAVRSRPELDDRTKLAFASAAEAAKQVLTLTTAVITVTIAFGKDVVTDASPAEQRWLQLAWLLYAVSILAGSFTLLALTGSLGSSRHETEASPTVYRSNIVLPAGVQMIAFALGMALTIVFALATLN
jgi:hypothetical protein